ncbi:hypothetical protein PVAP13_3KG244427 [Panicum virgatum]|uniref:Integrase catalytic domain-containing protein n=1 Tax=Panicum virgatum TaxID=38727 RepID=A0A8T0V298_PANVG|nr:hypothetical protein PVAP13_3KG244427 [Panicum virgatum]
MVSDRDPVFTSTFWRKLMRLMGTKLHMTTAFHPQSDGQTEAANRVIVMYLCCITGDRPRQWLRWLPWAEYIYNTTFQTSLRDTLFRVVYGRELPTIRSYEPGDTCVAAVARSMEERGAWRSAMSSWRTSAIASNRRRRSRRNTTTSLLPGGRLGPPSSPATRGFVPSSGRLRQAQAALLRALLRRRANRRSRRPASSPSARQAARCVSRQAPEEVQWTATRRPAATTSGPSRRHSPRTGEGSLVPVGTKNLPGSCPVEGGERCIGYVGGRRRLHRQVPKLPAQGRAAPRWGERCLWGRTYARNRRARDDASASGTPRSPR